MAMFQFPPMNQKLRRLQDEKEDSTVKYAVDGKDGKSAFELWLDQGNEGDLEDFFRAYAGKDGKDGKNGEHGYTPQKGVDYHDGKDGAPGIKGEPGSTPIKGVDYHDGKDGINGTNGENGKDGYTPKKGIDYFDGKDGINGINGKDGRTPIKGVDYHDGKDGKTPTIHYNASGNIGTVKSWQETITTDSKGAFDVDISSAGFTEDPQVAGATIINASSITGVGRLDIKTIDKNRVTGRITKGRAVVLGGYTSEYYESAGLKVSLIIQGK